MSTIQWNGLTLRPFITPRDIIAITSLSRSVVYELIASQQIPSIRVGRSVRVQAIDFIAWVDGLKTPKPAA